MLSSGNIGSNAAQGYSIQIWQISGMCAAWLKVKLVGEHGYAARTFPELGIRSHRFAL